MSPSGALIEARSGQQPRMQSSHCTLSETLTRCRCVIAAHRSCDSQHEQQDDWRCPGRAMPTEAITWHRCTWRMGTSAPAPKRRGHRRLGMRVLRDVTLRCVDLQPYCS